jgi:hypothetical protein
MRSIAFLTVVAIALLSAAQTAVLAVPIANLYNTGLDSLGNYQPTSAPDGNYTVIASPTGPFIPVAVDDTNYPIPPWVANNPTTSRWIGTSQLYSDGLLGNYTYRTSFSLPANAILSSVTISGQWAADNSGLDILVNGNSSGNVAVGFTSLAPFSLTSGFQIGLNTVDFIVLNQGGPTGLRVDKIDGRYNLVPEPATFLLGMISLGGLLMLRRA